MARRGGKISETRWGGFAGNFLAFAAGTGAVQLAASSPISRETILRTRGSLVCSIDGAAAPGALVLVSVGFQLVPSGTGTTVLRDPSTDAAAPWFYYTEFHVGYEEMVTDVVDVPGISSYREVIDSKAMRILRPETEIQMVVSNNTVAAAKSINICVAGRFLFGD